MSQSCSNANGFYCCSIVNVRFPCEMTARVCELSRGQEAGEVVI